MPAPAPGPRAARRGLTLSGFALVTFALGASASITLVSSGALSILVAAPSLHIVVGKGGSNDKYFKHLTLGANATTFTSAVKPRAGAEVNVRDALRLVSDKGGAQTVTLRGSSVINPQVLKFSWTLRDGPTVIGTLDHKALAPTVTFTLPGGATRHLDLRIELAEGAGKDNAAISFTMTVEVP